MIGELSREAENVIIDEFTPCTTREFDSGNTLVRNVLSRRSCTPSV
jgi:hypothetical protein